MRLVAPALLILVILSNVACSGSLQHYSANANNAQEKPGEWQPSKTVPGGFRRDLVGDTSQPGPFKYQLKIPAGARFPVHKHTKDVHVKVVSGSMFIIIGEPLESSRVKHFVAGNVFVVPAHAWHDEWWDEETILEAEGVGPSEMIYQNAPAELISRIDHIVYATPDLNRGIEAIEKLIGIRATPGGQHPGRGTRNALIAFGPTTYLEIIAPDPEQPQPEGPRPFGLDGLKEPRLAAWFVSGRDLNQLRRDAISKGVPLGEVKAGSRRRPDGVQLSWQFTDPWAPVGDGVVPLFIDWGDSAHPARTAASGARLVSLRGEHPDVKGVREMLRHLGIDLDVTEGPRPALIATIEGPRGRVELR